MAEVYSEVWVTVRTKKNPKNARDQINERWRDLLEKYRDLGVENDTGSMLGIGEAPTPKIENNAIKFGLGSHEKSGGPNYEAQYQAVGEMIWHIQNTLIDWNIDIEIQKTGASG